MINQRIPTQLRIVAILFIIGGVLALFEIVTALVHGNINLNYGVLGLFIGPGLIRLSRGWRTLALVFIWIAMIGLPLFGLLLLVSRGQITLSIFEQPAGNVPKPIGLLWFALLFALVIWQYRVLIRPDIRRLFGVDTAW